MRNYLLPTALFGSIASGTLCAIAIVSYASPAVALSPVEIQRMAKQSTVQITTRCDVGSGVIIRKEGNTYTVLTVAHTFKKKESCSPLEVITPDTSKYQIVQVKNFPNSVDLAAFTFTSSKSYTVAKLIDNSDRVEGMETIYVSGFPMSTAIQKATFVIVKGDVVANPMNTEQGNGYSLIYSNNTLPGHSGGPVWNDRGEVIAIHGRGDIDTKSQDTINSDVKVKNGYSLGITINTFNKLAATAGISGSTSTIATAPSPSIVFSPSTTPVPKPAATPAPIATKPASKPLNNLLSSFASRQKPVDDLIASAVKKENSLDYKGMLADANSAILLDPLNSRAYVIRGRANERSDGKAEIKYRAAYKDYTQAIALDPNNAEAYFYRAEVTFYDKKKKLADYDRAIAVNPNYVQAYSVRGNFRSELGNFQGAVEDYSRAISLGYDRYDSRGEAKFKSNDFRGAVEDYNRVIATQPKHVQAYYYRGMSKFKLGNPQGAIEDYSQAIDIGGYTPAYLARANAKSKRGDKQGAIADLTIAAKFYQDMIKSSRASDYGTVSSYTRWHQDQYQKVLTEIKRLGG